MPIDELDRSSEGLLNLFLKEQTLNISQIEIVLHQSVFDFSGYLGILLKRGYIQNADISNPNDEVVHMDGTYRITTAGENYFDFKSQAKWKYISRSVLTPIVLSFITALITTLITNYFKK